VLTSGDLGWAGLVVYVAELLAGRGYQVVGFNSRAYLASFTGKSSALSLDDVRSDYRALVEYAARTGGGRPVLAGISEGAGLSVLAATSPAVQSRIAGVLALGLPAEIALAWRWRDVTVWITKRSAAEPSFRVDDVIGRMAPVPLAEIHATHDEFLAIADARKLVALASEPKRMWAVEAANHRFSNNRSDLERCILEALRWIGQPR
jgi:type IV secretory pathway VirJ component